MQALLSAKNINVRSHRGLIQQFGQQFVKTGELSQESSRTLSETFDFRLLSDYDESIIITETQAKISLDNAKQFMNESRNWLENHHYL